MVSYISATSFLFISRLLNQGNRNFSWRFFFLSRIFRIVPLYIFTALLTVVSIMAVSQWQLQTGYSEMFKWITDWLLFTITKSPINNSDYTFLVTGVTWSLPYEWLFYISLPLISLVLPENKPPKAYLAACAILLAIFYWVHGLEPYYLLAFAGGAVAPFILKFTSLKEKIKHPYGSIIILICLLLIGRFHSANNPACLLLISILFTFVALGNSVFGLLKNPALKLLGEISYSTYLLHGLVLFTTFYFGLGFKEAKALSPLAYTLIIFGITPVLVLSSFFGFHFIEKPFILKAQKIRLKARQQTVSAKDKASLAPQDDLPVLIKSSGQ